jgi:hypothetical protein
METKYPEIVVDLVGQDGNAFFVLGKVQRELRRAKVSKEEQEFFMDEATSGDYNHLLQTVIAWVTVQ